MSVSRLSGEGFQITINLMEQDLKTQGQQLALDAIFDDAESRAELLRSFLVVEGKTYSYQQMIEQMRHLSGYFSECLVPGSTIAIASKSYFDVATLILAAIRFGHPVVNLNPDQASSELQNALLAVNAAHLFIDREIAIQVNIQNSIEAKLIDSEFETRSKNRLTRLLGKKSNENIQNKFQKEISEYPSVDWPANEDENATALLILTSGTSQSPKVVEISRRNLSAQIKTFRKVYQYSESRILNPLPPHFTDGILHGPIITFLESATLYRPRSFELNKVESLLDSIHRDRINYFIVVPAILSILNRLGDDFRDSFSTRDFKYIRSSGDHLPLALWRSIEKRFDVQVINTYGLSECVCEAAFCGPAAKNSRIGTIGKPVGCQIELFDSSDNAVGRGQEGELRIYGDITMKGYLGQPELTSEVFVDGWLKTGDIAVKDEDDFIHIVGRMSNTIISGGININPLEIVDVLLGNDAVSEAAAFGVSDSTFGEIVGCAVVLNQGFSSESDDDNLRTMLLNYCHTHLSSYKVPKLLSFVGKIPKNSSGKIIVSDLQSIVTLRESGRSSGIGTDLQVVDIAARVLGCTKDELHLLSGPGDPLLWDSFSHLSLIAKIEDIFQFRLSAREVLNVNNLGQLIELVEKKRKT